MNWYIRQEAELSRGETAGEKRQAIMPLAYPGNGNAHVWSVTVLNDGQVVDLTGATVTAYFQRSDGGSPVVVVGSITDNHAEVTFATEVYEVPGVVKAIMNLTVSNTSVMTIAAMTFRVNANMTDGPIDPSGEITLDVGALVSDIEAAVASIPSDYSDLLTTIAPTFSSSASYSAGQIVWYDGVLYRFTASHSGTWSSADATAVTICGDIVSLKNTVDGIEDDIDIMPTAAESDAKNVDFDIADPLGNVLVRFAGGNVKTKNFDSANAFPAPAPIDANVDLAVSDINGNALIIFRNGQFETKHFNSAYIRQLAGKKWTVLGDSLTEHNQRTTINYHDYIADETGIMVYNLAHSGCGYAKQGGNGQTFADQAANIPAGTDVITIFGSGNDKSSSLDLGTATDTGTTTICGCINTTLDVIYANYPTTPLGVITPTPWANSEPSDGETTMSAYCEKLVEICNLRGIPCLDLYHCSNLHPTDVNFRPLAYSKDNGDGVHPDETGHAIIAPRIRQFLFSLI